MKQILNFSALLAVAIGLAACQFREPEHRNFVPNPHGELPADTLLYETSQQFLSKSYFRCDSMLRDKIEEVSRALDKRRDQIVAFKSEGKAGRVLRIGPADFSLNAKPEKVDDKWKEDVKGWLSLYRRYLRIKDSPVDATWVSLYSSARAVMYDDVQRVKGARYETKPTDEKPLRAVLKKLQECKRSKCTLLDLREIEDPLEHQLIFWSDVEDFHGAKDVETQGKELDWLIRKVTQQVGNFEVDKRDFIERKGDKLMVKLDAGSFAGSESLMAQQFEEPWTSKKLSVKIDWKSKNLLPNIYEVLLGKGAFGRPIVNYNDQVMILYQGTRTTSLAHELGHVMGLPDQYFTYFDQSNCIYTDYSNAANIMSESATGKVLSWHWQKLEELYPLAEK